MLLMCLPANATAGEASSDTASASPRLTSLAISPAGARWNDSLNVSVGFDQPGLVERIQFFMCIIEPRTICYPPKIMAQSGDEYLHSTETLDSYPLASPTMNIGVRFVLKTSGGELLVPTERGATLFGYQVTNNSHNLATLYFIVPVVGEPEPSPATESPYSGLVAPLVVASAAFLLILLGLVRWRRHRRRQAPEVAKQESTR